MYKKYLEPNHNDVTLTKYMTKKIKQRKKNPNISNHSVSSYCGDDCLIEDRSNNVEIAEGVIENDEPPLEEEVIPNDVGDDDFFNSISDQLVHPNLECKIADTIAMILAFFLQHNLTWVALEDLLILFENILGEDSSLPKTKYFFKKCFGDTDRAIFHFYCKKCLIYIGTYADIKHIDIINKDNRNHRNICTICQSEYALKKMNEGHFFVQIPLRDQIEKKISENIDMLDYDTTSNSIDVSDVFDGELYKSLRAKIGLGSLITLTLNTDGVRVFKSKRKSSLWPIQLFINEVPPNKRFKQDNIILTGIWFGKDPDFDLYLKPLSEEMKDLDEKKISATVNNLTRDVTVRLLHVTADLPAKAKYLKLKQYNGKFGCNYCLHPGVLLGTSTTSKYTLSSNEYILRTHSSTIALMSLYSATGKGSFGVTGVSPLIGFKDFDLIRGSVIDYMHCVLSGVVYLLLDLWFDSENHREKFYVTPRGQEVINRNIKTIKPLKTFSRKPRVIDDKAFWKAHEFKYWLLFYGVPCLKGTLKEVYLNHFALLSEAIFIFLKPKITPSDYSKASKNLIKFTKDFQNHYGEINMMHNVHLLPHLPKCVKDCGPLWAYSNFNFESNNGSLVKHVKGTTDVEHQISSKYSFNNVLASLRKQNETIFHYMDRMKSMRVKITKKIGQITLFGNSRKHKLESNEKPILKNYSEYIMAYNKFFCYNDVYYSITYKRAEQTNDTVVRLKDQSIGQISLIYEEQGKVLLLLKILKIESVPQFPAHIKKICKNLTDQYIIVPADEVSEKLLLISITSENYLSQLPNNYEGD